MAVAVVVPKLGMTMEEATLLKWLVADGASVRKGDLIFEAESEKISFEGEAEADGTLRQVAAEGDTVPAGGVLAYILAEGEPMPAPARPSAEVPAPQRQSAPAQAAAAVQGRVPASPIARRLAAELGIDLSTLQGTGPGGRVVEADVRAAARAASGPKVARRLPLSGLRKAIAARMTGSLQHAAQFTLHLEVDVTEALMQRRSGSGDYGTADLILRACALALGKHPRLNAWITGEEITEFADVNIGFAVPLPDGLIVPVLRNASAKDLSMLAKERAILTERARAGFLTHEDVEAATFTVSVLGLVDGFTPIINPPQVAVLGAGRVMEKPLARNKTIELRSTLMLSLTVDHRAVDGEPAARFLREVGRLLEHPETLLSGA
jgi:pyruvate dehydrogenase E2 component (dihydrolipoamide acetyltransferase)